MRSSVSDVLASAVKRSLAKSGSDLATSRRKRGLATIALAERMGVSKNTYLRVEQGDDGVGLGTYAKALFMRGIGEIPSSSIDVSRADTGLLPDEECLPNRVRMKRSRMPPP